MVITTVLLPLGSTRRQNLRDEGDLELIMVAVMGLVLTDICFACRTLATFQATIFLSGAAILLFIVSHRSNLPALTAQYSLGLRKIYHLN